MSDETEEKYEAIGKAWKIPTKPTKMQLPGLWTTLDCVVCGDPATHVYQGDPFCKDCRPPFADKMKVKP